MNVKKLTKKEFYSIYFKTYVLNGFNKLTNNQIRTLVGIITFNDNRLRPESPYYGKGREELLKRLNISQSAYSTILNKLSSKGLLIKGQQDYALSVTIMKLKEYVDQNPKLSIVHYYEIVDDESNSRGSSEKAKSKSE